MDFQKANARTAQFASQGLELPYSEDLTILQTPVTGDGFTAPNAFCIHPMEGCDSTLSGSPDELTIRRYERFAKSGAGLIWVEAVAVHNDGRANPRQLCMTADTYDGFARIREKISKDAASAGHKQPVVVMQLTHSGRFSNHSGSHDPVCAWRHTSLDSRFQKQAETLPVSDDYLARIPEWYSAAARRAKTTGYDGVDIKCCHLYLFSELLSAYDRPGRYGGSFENRTRLFLECVEAAASESPGILCSRLNVYDSMPMGFGVKTDGSLEIDFDEPKRLVRMLANAGVRLIDVTMGTPYFNPHVNRPYNSGGYTPPETAETGVARLLSGARMAAEADKRVRVVGTGFSQLAEAAAPVAAGCIEQGWLHFAGIGRLAFAYPDFPAHVFSDTVDEKKLCICCGKCTEIMRAGSTAGCPVRDKIYAEIYKRDVLER